MDNEPIEDAERTEAEIPADTESSVPDIPTEPSSPPPGDIGGDTAAAVEEQPFVDETPFDSAEGQFSVNNQPVQTLGDRGLDFILDIPLDLVVEVGRTKMQIGELLALGPGSVVELEKLAGEPLEVYVNNKLVANGEAVVVNEKFGVRLTNVISKSERIEGLGS